MLLGGGLLVPCSFCGLALAALRPSFVRPCRAPRAWLSLPAPIRCPPPPPSPAQPPPRVLARCRSDPLALPHFLPVTFCVLVRPISSRGFSCPSWPFLGVRLGGSRGCFFCFCFVGPVRCCCFLRGVACRFACCGAGVPLVGRCAWRAGFSRFVVCGRPACWRGGGLRRRGWRRPACCYCGVLARPGCFRFPCGLVLARSGCWRCALAPAAAWVFCCCCVPVLRVARVVGVGRPGAVPGRSCVRGWLFVRGGSVAVGLATPPAPARVSRCVSVFLVGWRRSPRSSSPVPPGF